MTDPKTLSAEAARAMVDDLERLIEAIDRRVPQLARVGEGAIARDAADIRERATTLMQALAAVADGSSRNLADAG